MTANRSADTLPAPPRTRMTEIKEPLGGGEPRRFDLERWLWTPDVVVGRWTAPASNPFGVPEGATSWGVWWAHRPYGAYRIHEPSGDLRLYRIDALEQVKFTNGKDSSVRYRDLLLDALIASDGEVTIEDEDEVEAAQKAGSLSAEQLWRIEWVRSTVEAHTKMLRGRIDRAIEDAIRTVRQLETI